VRRNTRSNRSDKKRCKKRLFFALEHNSGLPQYYANPNRVASVTIVRRPHPAPGPSIPKIGSPLGRFLERLHCELEGDDDGAVADYIPELGKANPQHFGVALATIDGHIYEVGDSRIEFTIQSISKAFVFALALETVGHQQIEACVGVEPSGEAFNSIRLNGKNQPFNPMVNAGAIACSGLIYQQERDGAFEKILDTLGRFAGRKLSVDEQVYASESKTGDRNRAIAWLLRNYAVIQDDVDAVLDVYFRQCSILVTARDLAAMAATLANDGVNPLTGLRVISSYSVARTLSVMTSSGMYDYAGEWIYRIGIPAKSGVGGGIIAALPSQFGLGTFSPLLDSHGNSVRGLKLCESLSAHFDLHLLNCVNDVRTCIVADYVLGHLKRGGRQPHEQAILDKNASAIRILELTGTLTFANVDHITRLIQSHATSTFLILDMRRVPLITNSAAKMLAGTMQELMDKGAQPIVAGLKQDSHLFKQFWPHLAENARLRNIWRLDEAIEWAEDQLIFRHGGFTHVTDSSLAEQELLSGLSSGELADLEAICETRNYRPGDKIIAREDSSDSVFFLQQGMVSVKLADGVRVATLVPGAVFGELALIALARTADVWADNAVRCQRIGLDAFDDFRSRHPAAAERIMRNLACLLAKRLSQANTRINLLSSI
jgi:glutaminase